MNLTHHIKCLFYNTLSLEFRWCSWMWLIKEIVIGYQQEGPWVSDFAGPVLHSELKEPLSKFKGKQLPQRTQIANPRPHSELAEDRKIKLLSQSPTYDNYCYCMALRNWHLKIFHQRCRNNEDKNNHYEWRPASYEMQASALVSIGAHNAHCPLSNCLGHQES